MISTIMAIVLLAQLVIKPEDLILLLAPIITWLASMAANWVKAKLGTQGFGGTVLITMIVPIMGFFASLIVEALAAPALSFIVIFALSFAGVFINQFIKQWTQTLRGVQNSVLPNITTVKKEPKL